MNGVGDSLVTGLARACLLSLAFALALADDEEEEEEEECTEGASAFEAASGPRLRIAARSSSSVPTVAITVHYSKTSA